MNRSISALVVSAALASIPLAAREGAAHVQGRLQQRCVQTLHRDGQRVAEATARQISTCLHGAEQGGVTDLAICLTADDGGEIEAATARAAGDAIEHCTVTPADFGVPAAFDQTISDAAAVHTRGLATDLLGDSPAAAADPAGARCQSSTLQRAQALVRAQAKSFARCTRERLKAGATEAAELASCLTDGATAKIARAERRLRTLVERRCIVAGFGDVLPGRCADLAGAALSACVAERARCRACRLLATSAALDVDCDLADDATADASCSFPVSISGNAIPFAGGPSGRVEGADVWILEHPEMHFITGADGAFQFDGLEEGSEVTLVMDHPDYHPIQTGTHRLGASGAERVTFQAVTWPIYNLLAAFLGIVPDEANRCQMVTTVTRVGKSVYDPGAHGEDATTVITEPRLPDEHGPIYFNSAVLPTPGLRETSDDGGVLYVQVPPGEYVWTAYKPGVVFTRIKSKCRVGLLVNASPPWGLQAH